MEEEYIQQMCEDLIRVKPDLVIMEKGVSGNSTCHPLCGIHLSEINGVKFTAQEPGKNPTKTKKTHNSKLMQLLSNLALGFVSAF